MNDWPVRIILMDDAFQRGFDRALELADACPPDRLGNPYRLDQNEWFGFAEGLVEAERIARDKAGINLEPSPVTTMTPEE